MDYYYYDQDGKNELEGNEDYDYYSMALSEEESFNDVYQGCMKSSTQQVQKYIMVLLGCGILQRVSWELLRRTAVGNMHKYLYHLFAIVSGLICLLFYVGLRSSIYVCLHVLNLCFFLKLALRWKVKHMGALLCVYTIVCQLLFEFFLKSEQYETIRGPQMVVGMKLVSLAFEVQDEREEYQLLTFLGYLLSPASLILGPWVSLKDYSPDFNAKIKLGYQVGKICLNIFFAIAFLNFSNCIVPWLKQLLNTGIWWSIYLDGFSVRCSHYFVCYLSQATLLTTTSKTLIFSSSSPASTQFIVNPLEIEFPRSLSVVVRNWNIPMHLWLKQNIFKRLRSAKCPYFGAILLTFMVSCLVHGFNYKVHLVLISLGCFSYFENILRRYLAKVFNACLESTGCKYNCKYTNCPRSKNQIFSLSILLVRLVNFIFSVIVIFQLAYLGVMLNDSTSNTMNILQIWSNMYYLGHILAMIMFVFYKCI